jgi:RNA polymerase sigma-70 factor (ECF subfamily)
MDDARTTRMQDPKRTLIERLFTHHSAALLAFFHRRIKSKSEAADLVQEVYLRMLRVKDADAIKNPEGYLFTVASNLFIEQSVLQRRQSTAASFDAAPDGEVIAPQTSFEELFDSDLRVARLREVLAQLPPKCQAAVHMKYQHGLKYDEIAEKLNISPHMVQKYLGTALAHCRRRMGRLMQ